MGVVVSVLRLLCCHVGCSPTRLSTLIAFLPPSPGSYRIFDSKFRDSTSHLVVPLHHSLRKVKYEAIYVSPPGGGADSIPCVYLSPLHSPPPRQVVLFAHGNATDLGLSLQNLAYLAERLGVGVFAFDYPGYGAADGIPPNLRQAHEWTAAVYNYIVFERKLCPRPEASLILYGQSLGSVFVCELVKRGQARYSGVVLHSPFASGVRLVLNPHNSRVKNQCIASCLGCLEVFPNERNVAHANAPVFVIHGLNDSAIPCHHGKSLDRAVPAALRFPGFFPAADHNDVDILHEQEYFAKLEQFLRHCLDVGGGGGGGGGGDGADSCDREEDFSVTKL